MLQTLVNRIEIDEAMAPSKYLTVEAYCLITTGASSVELEDLVFNCLETNNTTWTGNADIRLQEGIGDLDSAITKYISNVMREAGKRSLAPVAAIFNYSRSSGYIYVRFYEVSEIASSKFYRPARDLAADYNGAEPDVFAEALKALADFYGNTLIAYSNGSLTGQGGLYTKLMGREDYAELVNAWVKDKLFALKQTQHDTAFHEVGSTQSAEINFRTDIASVRRNKLVRSLNPYYTHKSVCRFELT